MKLLKVARGGILFFENKIDKNVYVIKKGRVELRKDEGLFLHNGLLNKKIVLVEGDVFGFEELFLNINRDHRAVVIEDAELLYFEFNEFSNVIKGNIKVGEKILNSLSQKIRNLNNKIREISNIENDWTESDDEKMKDIFMFFIKNGELKKASEMLDKLSINERYKEFAKKNIERIPLLKTKNIDKAIMLKIIDMYDDYEKELLSYVLNGLRKTVTDDYALETLLVERMNLLSDLGYDDEYIEEAVSFLKLFSYSEKCIDIGIGLIEKYELKGEYPLALKTTLSILNKRLDKESIERLDGILGRLKSNLKSFE